MNEVNTPCETKKRLEWVEPQARQLDVRETSFQPGRGRDGQKIYLDCTRS